MPSSEQSPNPTALSNDLLRAQLADLIATLELALDLMPDPAFDEFLCRLAIERAKAESGVSQSPAPNPVDPLVQALVALRAEFSALREQIAGMLCSDKRIEPDAVYSVREAAEKVSISSATLCRKLRARIIQAKGGTKGCPWRIRGSELLKLGGKVA